MEIVSIKTVFITKKSDDIILVLAISNNNCASIGDSVIIDSTNDELRDAARAAGIIANKWAKIARGNLEFDFNREYIHVMPQSGVTCMDAKVAFVEVTRETFDELINYRRRISMDIIRPFEINIRDMDTPDKIEEALKRELIASYVPDKAGTHLVRYIQETLGVTE